MPAHRALGAFRLRGFYSIVCKAKELTTRFIRACGAEICNLQQADLRNGSGFMKMKA